MRKRLLGLALLVPALSAMGEEDGLARLTRGQPRDVVSVAKRAEICHHMAGEEPYDAARGREIARTLNRYRCGTLEQDQARVLKRYRARKAAIARIFQKIEALDY